MELFKHDLAIDFIKYRRVAVVGSLTINLLVLLGVAVFGLNMGVDFAGGSEIGLKFKTAITAEQVRKTVEAAGFKEPSVQEYGNASDHSYLMRIGVVSLLTKEQGAGIEAGVKAALGDDLGDFNFNPDLGDKFEMHTKSNLADDAAKAALEAKIRGAFEAKSVGLMAFSDSPSVTGTGRDIEVTTRGIADKLDKAFKELDGAKADDPDSRIQSIDYVGPQVGKELRNRGILSVIYAMISILLYVFFRFDFRFAPGGVVALIHDVIVVLGYYVVSRREFNLVSVSVLLTIVGYSINDTIVVYDRIRENMGKYRGKDFPTVINMSINETLSRTVLTSGATALSLIGLLFFSVGSIWDFAAAMMVGIITGTYSSIYIASPVTIWLEEQMGRHSHLKNGPPPAVVARA